MERSYEEILVEALISKKGRPFATMTDAYKWSMAQAGFPLRRETFYLVLRRGGPYYIPFDLKKIVQLLLPDLPGTKEQGFLQANGYGMSGAMEKALSGSVEVWAAPKGSWVLAKEPILTVTGPSFLVSWLEPLLIMLQYPIQVATAYVGGETTFPAVCFDEVKLLGAVAGAVREDYARNPMTIPVDEQGYRDRVRENALKVVAALGGDAHRAFEVGLRGANTMRQHLIALEELKKVGVNQTSNVYGAWVLYMIPVGTTGHEHQMRWGNDEAGFRAIRDMRPETPSYLFDTNDPCRLGIPAALAVMYEEPDRPCTFRFDSGDQDNQFLQIRRGCSRNTESILHEQGLLPTLPPMVIVPNLIFEDSYDDVKTVKNEAFCDAQEWPRDKRRYGYGGFWISRTHPTPYTRDVCSSCYKLTYSNGATQKFSGSPGKDSVPGKPVILRWVKVPDHIEATYMGDSLIAQEGESIVGYIRLDRLTGKELRTVPLDSTYSPQTEVLRTRLREERDARVIEGSSLVAAE